MPTGFLQWPRTALGGGGGAASVTTTTTSVTRLTYCGYPVVPQLKLKTYNNTAYDNVQPLCNIVIQHIYIYTHIHVCKPLSTIYIYTHTYIHTYIYTYIALHCITLIHTYIHASLTGDN